MWQDYVIALTVMAFTLTTIPMIVNKVKLPLWTTAPMVTGSVALGATYVTMGLWLGALTELIALILWANLLKKGVR